MIYSIQVTGDYCAIEVYEYTSFKQVGEFFGRLGSLTKFSDIVKEVVKYLAVSSNGQILIGVEDNSIGSAIIENLQNDNTFTFEDYMYSDNKDQYKYGINTNTKTKDQMISVFYDYINSEPKLISSSNLIDQLSVIEKKSNGSVASKHGHHDDLFMASCLCAYMKKRTSLDPKYNASFVENVKSQIKESNLVNDVIINQSKSSPYGDDLEIFRSERELIKQELDDFEDFTF